ncbi:MAG: DUF1501 domain-containing protein [Planctomycetia bacterium]|nr:DUF1501 domain-containing protein [Planctomycetia bacterium]
MLKILGSANPFRRACDRREALRIGALGAASLSLPQLFQLEALAALQGQSSTSQAFGKAKRILLLYLQGAASQFETWDPKPLAPAEIRGKWGATSTAVPGVAICDRLPRIAQVADRLAIVRSMTHAHNNHSNLYTLTGYPALDFTSETNPLDGRHHPFFCSVLDYLEDQQGSAEPPEVPRNIGLPFRFTTYGQLFRRAGPYGTFLGQGYDPVWTEFDGKATKKVSRISFFDALKGVNVEDPYLGITPDSRLRITKSAQLRPEMTLDRLDSRRSLLDQLDGQNRQLNDTLAGKSLDRFSQMAYSFMTSQKLRDALDLGREPMSLREQYGMTLFGQAALTGRRLLEAGCQLVSVFWDEYKIVNTAWDTHFDHFTRLGDELLPGFDAAVSTLLVDLEARGLLDETLVLCLSEHGRTAKINNFDRGGGRDHWSKVYSVMLAGAGIRGGAVVGASDAAGSFVKDRPVSPEDILATMYHLKGIDPDTTIPDRLKRPVRLVENGTVIDELLA